MLTKDLSITFCGVKFPNPFCLSSSPVGNCYEMCAKAYDTGWGGVVFKTIGFFIANEVSPRFDHLVKEDTGFIGFKNIIQNINIFLCSINISNQSIDRTLII